MYRRGPGANADIGQRQTTPCLRRRCMPRVSPLVSYAALISRARNLRKGRSTNLYETVAAEAERIKLRGKAVMSIDEAGFKIFVHRSRRRMRHSYRHSPPRRCCKATILGSNGPGNLIARRSGNRSPAPPWQDSRTPRGRNAKASAVVRAAAGQGRPHLAW